MKIFDRWGNMVFESYDIEDGWNGKDVFGKIMGLGVYSYRIVLYYNSKLHVYNGEINLMR